MFENNEQEVFVDKCPACNSENINRTVYKLPYSIASYKMTKVMEKWHLNIVVEVNCLACGYHYRE